MAKRAFRIFSPKGRLVILLLLLVLGALFMIVRQRYPIINDITTDLQNPPSFFATLEESGVDAAQMQYPEAFMPLQEAAYPFLRPLAVVGSPDEIFAKALLVAETKMGWKVVAKDLENRKFQAIAITEVLRLKDDVVVTVEGIEDKSIVNMRSKSRVGRGDFGANQRRILTFINELSGSSAESQ